MGIDSRFATNDIDLLDEMLGLFKIAETILFCYVLALSSSRCPRARVKLI